ncbi:hypothetical protein C8J57DRAFT_1532016 [Mycena rebaudengoi]|nr:hypothetical protein C8J57DRAFT_1532016 [Mycena rebaudengoi]
MTQMSQGLAALASRRSLLSTCAAYSRSRRALLWTPNYPNSELPALDVHANSMGSKQYTIHYATTIRTYACLNLPVVRS